MWKYGSILQSFLFFVNRIRQVQNNSSLDFNYNRECNRRFKIKECCSVAGSCKILDMYVTLYTTGKEKEYGSIHIFLYVLFAIVHMFFL